MAARAAGPADPTEDASGRGATAERRGVTKAAEGRTQVGWWVALAVGMVPLALLLRFPALFEPTWYGDEGVFAAVASELRNGQALYRDVWDLKPPFIFYTFALIQWLAGPGIVPLRLAAMAALAGTVAAVMLVVRGLGLPRRAWLAGLIAALALGTPVIEANLALTETFLVLFTALGALAFVGAARAEDRRAKLVRYAFAGILLGVAANYKQVALWEAGAFVLMALVYERRPSLPVAALLAGIALPHLLVLGVVAAQAAWPEYWSAIGGEGFRRYRELSPDPGPLRWGLRFVPVALAVAVVVGARWRRGRVPLLAVAPLWAAAAMAGSLSSTYGYPHYLQQAVPGVAVALAVVPLHVRRADAWRLAAGGAAAAAFVFTAYTQFDQDYRYRDHHSLRYYYGASLSFMTGRIDREQYNARFDFRVRELDAVVAALPRGDGSLFAWDDWAWVYARTGLENPTRFYMAHHVEFLPGAREEAMADIRAAPPDFVLFSIGREFADLAAFLDAEYTPVASGDGWVLWRRADGG